MRISGSTIGTMSASWHSAAYRAIACMFATIAKSVGRSPPTSIGARHFANRAPIAPYSARRSRNPSRPSVTVSPGNPARGFAPVSTLIPGIDPASRITSTKVRPSSADWRIVSSNRITPLMCSPNPGVVNSICR